MRKPSRVTPAVKPQPVPSPAFGVSFGSACSRCGLRSIYDGVGVRSPGAPPRSRGPWFTLGYRTPDRQSTPSPPSAYAPSGRKRRHAPALRTYVRRNGSRTDVNAIVIRVDEAMPEPLGSWSVPTVPPHASSPRPYRRALAPRLIDTFP